MVKLLKLLINDLLVRGWTTHELFISELPLKVKLVTKYFLKNMVYTDIKLINGTEMNHIMTFLPLRSYFTCWSSLKHQIGENIWYSNNTLFEKPIFILEKITLSAYKSEK